MTALKPCPFCGNCVKVSEKINFSYFVFSHADTLYKTCPLTVRAYTKTKTQAICKWNNRKDGEHE